MSRRAPHLLFAVLGSLATGCAHQAASPAPATAVDRPPVVDGDVVSATVAGLPILIKRVPSAEFVAAQLVIRGGVRNWTPATAGVEQLAVAVATRGGTEALDKDAFSRRLAALGASIGGGSGEDYATLAAKSPQAAFPEIFGLLVDCFLRPALPASEIEVQRQAQLARLRREKDIPDARLQVMAHEALFQGHPFAMRAVGTLDNVGKLDLAALRAHLAGLRQTSRLLLVVVGDVDAAAVIEAARKAFAGVPRGDYQERPLPPLAVSAARLTGEARPLPTSYIQSAFPGPSWRDPDLVPAMVAMSLLGQREWDEVRTKRNLSYAPSAWFRSPSMPFGGLYVTAVDPATTMKVMLDEARRLRDQLVPDAELGAAKSVYLTRLLMASESTDGQAALLARMQVLAGDWRRVRTLPDEVRAVAPAQVQAFARKWMGRWQTVILGDPARLDPALFTAF